MKDIDPDNDPRIMVFGSNLRGAHGKGAALFAKMYKGVQYGVGEGPTGRAYALPTKDERIRSLPLPAIKIHVDKFLEYARANPAVRFQVTRVGCGLAGYTDKDIGPMFARSPENCDLPDEWLVYRTHP